MMMIFDYQEMDEVTEKVAQQEEQAQEYWTKERMENAEPQPMPTVSNINRLKEIVSGTLPILIILFIAFAFAFTLMNIRKINALENKNKEILKELSNIKKE